MGESDAVRIGRAGEEVGIACDAAIGLVSISREVQGECFDTRNRKACERAREEEKGCTHEQRNVLRIYGGTQGPKAGPERVVVD